MKDELGGMGRNNACSIALQHGAAAFDIGRLGWFASRAGISSPAVATALELPSPR
jgi:hypothetical protein